MPSHVTITSEEFATLRSRITGQRHLDVQFSASGMRLENTPVNYWVFPILADMRGLND